MPGGVQKCAFCKKRSLYGRAMLSVLQIPGAQDHGSADQCRCCWLLLSLVLSVQSLYVSASTFVCVCVCVLIELHKKIYRIDANNLQEKNVTLLFWNVYKILSIWFCYAAYAEKFVVGLCLTNQGNKIKILII